MKTHARTHRNEQDRWSRTSSSLSSENRFCISPNIVPLINHKCEREGKQWASTYVNTQMTSRHSMKLNEKKNTRKEIERQRERETVFSLLILRVMWLDFTTESHMLSFLLHRIWVARNLSNKTNINTQTHVLHYLLVGREIFNGLLSATQL